MRETELWERLDKHLGPAYSRVWAEQNVLPGLGRTVREAIADGVSFKRIWLAVWEALELPAAER
ncbi:DUF3046 domain-containing protein [Naumannella halotolerans]|uniref:DUF3046 domain-containing protein n=1 Tax=Naumannella halotolerans TaxID=993414 RepID=UPI00105C3A4E|nr:DUF3046 domain-containing protein [Naumannella halotolerans]